MICPGSLVDIVAMPVQFVLDPKPALLEKYESDPEYGPVFVRYFNFGAAFKVEVIDQIIPDVILDIVSLRPCG